MTKNEQIANIIAFFSIMFGEDHAVWNKVMELHPNYVIEKFERYILSLGIEYPWGMHPSLRNHRFHSYIDKWELELKGHEDEWI